MLGSLLTGLIPGIFNAIWGSANQESSDERNFEMNKQLMLYSSGLQKDYQSWLLNSQMPMQVNALKNAGLNPALLNGSGGSAVSATSPSGVKSPSPFPNIDIGNNISSIASAMLADKQADYYDALKDNLDADTRNKGKEGNLLDKQIETFYEDFKSRLNLQLQQSESYKYGALLNQSRQKEIDANIDKMGYEMVNLLSEIQKNESFAHLTRKQAENYDFQIKSIIAKNFAEAGLANGRNNREAQETIFKILQADSLTKLYNSETQLNQVNNDIQKFVLKYSNRYGDAQQITQILGNVLNGIGSVAGSAIGGYFGAAGKAKFFGGSSTDSNPFNWD